MPRETLVQRRAREAEQERIRLEAARIDYPSNLYEALESATNEGARFQFEDGNILIDLPNHVDTFVVPFAFNKNAEDDLHTLTSAIESIAWLRKQEEERRNARARALAKLTTEEKQLLGL